MALITCPDCSKEVSENATQCIYCGAPLSGSKTAKSTSNTKIILLIAVGVIVGIVGWQLLAVAPVAIMEGLEAHKIESEENARRNAIDRQISNERQFRVDNSADFMKLEELREKEVGADRSEQEQEQEQEAAVSCQEALRSIPKEDKERIAKIDYSFYALILYSLSTTPLTAKSYGDAVARTLREEPELGLHSYCKKFVAYHTGRANIRNEIDELEEKLRKKAISVGVNSNDLF